MPENSCSTRKSNDAGFPDLHARVFLAAFLLTSLLAITTAMGCHNFLVSRDVKMPLTPSIAFGAAMWLWWAAIALGMWGCAKRSPAMLDLHTSRGTDPGFGRQSPLLWASRPHSGNAYSRLPLACMEAGVRITELPHSCPLRSRVDGLRPGVRNLQLCPSPNAA